MLEDVEEIKRKVRLVGVVGIKDTEELEQSLEAEFMYIGMMNAPHLTCREKLRYGWLTSLGLDGKGCFNTKYVT